MFFIHKLNTFNTELISVFLYIIGDKKLFKILHKSKMLLILGLLISSSAMSTSLQVKWADNSSNESGFQIKKRTLDSNEYQIVSNVATDSTEYIDSDVRVEETYCYIVSAYNEAGSNDSEESCLYVDNTVEVPPVDEGAYTFKNVSISHEVIDKPNTIDLENKELYSFKNQESFNEDYSDSAILNAEYIISSGKAKAYGSSHMAFADNGEELINGYTVMNFNTGNQLVFDLYAKDKKETASLYLKSGIWAKDTAAVFVTVGDKTEKLLVPKGFRWYYFKVDIEVDGTAPVTITTDSNQSGYSAVMIAGIVLNSESGESDDDGYVAKYGSLVDVNTISGKNVDVNDYKFAHALGVTGNNDYSTATFDGLSFNGEHFYDRNVYSFTNDDNAYSGFVDLPWKDGSSIDLKLKSGDNEINLTSLYFVASAWSQNQELIQIVINGQTETIRLESNYETHFYKVDVEFEGELDLQIKPVGTIPEISGYGVVSAIKFVGLTLE